MSRIGTYLIAVLASIAIPSIAMAVSVTVTPGNMDGWTFYSTDDSGIINTGNATGGMVNGPSTPPLGTGSAHLATGPGAGDGSEQLRNTDWLGTRLADLTSLSYSTYATSWNGAQLPYLTIYLDTTGGNVRDDRLWFEPEYSRNGYGNPNNTNPQPAPALNIWQNWDALNGMWYNDNGPSGPGQDAITLAQYLATFPNARIVDGGQGGTGGIRIATGFASAIDSFDTNVDAFTIGTNALTKTYNFELASAAPVPLPASVGVGFSMLAGFGAMFAARKRLSRKPRIA